MPVEELECFEFLDELILDRRDGHYGDDAALTCLLAEIVPYDGH
jgi:hypothetical protein